MSEGYAARKMDITIEAVDPQAQDLERTLKHLQHPAGVCPGDIPVKPARTFRLYDDGADTLLTAGTYDTGTSHKTHPVPVLGYRDKSFKFRADTDSTADGLAVEELTQEGNWRTWTTRTYAANDYEIINPSGQAVLMRLAYEPAANGASITDAEAVIGG